MVFFMTIRSKTMEERQSLRLWGVRLLRRERRGGDREVTREWLKMCKGFGSQMR